MNENRAEMHVFVRVFSLAMKKEVFEKKYLFEDTKS